MKLTTYDLGFEHKVSGSCVPNKVGSKSQPTAGTQCRGGKDGKRPRRGATTTVGY